MTYDHGIPINPVLLAYDARMREWAMDLGELIEWDEEVDMGGDGEMDVDILEEK